MAHKTPLASWLYSNRNSLGTVFKEFNWPRQYLPDVFDFSTKILFDGIEAEGRGVDSIREIALEKSASEAIERLICKVLKFNSVGLALTGSFDPSPHARFEALERYFLDYHIDHQIDFELVRETNSLAEQFRLLNPKTKLSFYRMATTLEFYGVVCVIESSVGSAIALGFALSESLNISLRRSLFEALPNFTWLLDQSKVECRTQEGIPWHIGEKFLDKIKPLLKANQISESQIIHIESPPLEKLGVNYSQIEALRMAPIQLARFVVVSPNGGI